MKEPQKKPWKDLRHPCQSLIEDYIFKPLPFPFPSLSV